MAGGRGTRLNRGEKPLVRLNDIPVIEYVLASITGAGLKPVVITSHHTPYTANYCRVRCIDQIYTEGAGYIADLREVISFLDEDGPILTACADIPGLSVDHLTYIMKKYWASKKPACSVWIPLEERAELAKDSDPYAEIISGVKAVPAGINILHGSSQDEEQEEVRILIDDSALSYNINTPDDLCRCEDFFRQNK
ncbi:MAG TPA: NTP transferase domain-containing protein [Methanospirillum sp.]|nr:NTP transferase domain-containing protein [Methanospirillum sp.]